jgi:uncharacterized protein with PQ loop repeat
MAPQPTPPAAHAAVPDKMLRRALGAMSFFTIVMTVPQVWTIWIDHQAAGVSVLSWSAYLLSALLWFWHGLRQRDRNIYIPCIAWIAADAAVVVGTLVYG